MPHDELTNFHLRASVWNKEPFDRSKLFGEINIPLTKEIVNNQNWSFYLNKKVNIVRV